jgi:hypothetical protein
MTDTAQSAGAAIKDVKPSRAPNYFWPSLALALLGAGFLYQREGGKVFADIAEFSR